MTAICYHSLKINSLYYKLGLSLGLARITFTANTIYNTDERFFPTVSSFESSPPFSQKHGKNKSTVSKMQVLIWKPFPDKLLWDTRRKQANRRESSNSKTWKLHKPKRLHWFWRLPETKQTQQVREDFSWTLFNFKFLITLIHNYNNIWKACKQFLGSNMPVNF